MPVRSYSTSIINNPTMFKIVPRSIRLCTLHDSIRLKPEIPPVTSALQGIRFLDPHPFMKAVQERDRAIVPVHRHSSAIFSAGKFCHLKPPSSNSRPSFFLSVPPVQVKAQDLLHPDGWTAHHPVEFSLLHRWYFLHRCWKQRPCGRKQDSLQRIYWDFDCKARAVRWQWPSSFYQYVLRCNCHWMQGILCCYLCQIQDPTLCFYMDLSLHPVRKSVTIRNHIKELAFFWEQERHNINKCIKVVSS